MVCSLMRLCRMPFDGIGGLESVRGMTAREASSGSGSTVIGIGALRKVWYSPESGLKV